MTKIYNTQHFTAVDASGVTYVFTCWTTHTRTGFCHHCECQNFNYPVTRISYYNNRTWESFCYESALYRYFKKLPARLRELCTAQIIDKISQEERERAERFTSTFRGLWDNLSEDNKEMMRAAVGNEGVTSEGQAAAAMALAFMLQ